MNQNSAAIDPRLASIIAEQAYPHLFVTISGAHLYGFPSPDSDYDLRGVHLLPLENVVGLDTGPDTLERSMLRDGLDIDLVTHDAAKFFRLLLKKNGYVLEQLYSPLIVHTTPAHDELKTIVRGCVTRHHAHHYLGFAATQWKLFTAEQPPRIKPLLYTYRVLLTGIHLMRTGEVEANLVHLNDEHRLSHVTDLIAAKTTGTENGRLDPKSIAFHESEYERLVAALEQAAATTMLPDAPTTRPALHALLVRLRMFPK